MKEQLITLLESFGYPVFLQGSLASPEDYPEAFFTFWNFSAPENMAYDNAVNRCVWGYWVYFYSTDPVQVNTLPEQARQLLKANGFTPDGRPHDLAADAPDYTGAMFTVYGIEYYEQEQEE